MYMLFEADAAFIFISSVSIRYIPRIAVNYLPSSDRHQQPSGSGPDVLPSGESPQFARGGEGGVKIRIAGSTHTRSSSCQTHSKNKICY